MTLSFFHLGSIRMRRKYLFEKLLPLTRLSATTTNNDHVRHHALLGTVSRCSSKLTSQNITPWFDAMSRCIAAGTNSGYRIFNCEPFGRNEYVTEGGIGIVQMLFSTSLVALVGGGENPAFSPRCLKLWNSQSATTICKLDFATRILTVHMNRTRLVVVLADKLHIYDLESMKNLHVLDCVDVAGVKAAVAGVCALSPNSERCFLGMPTGT
jgi:autophagy-related protein 18